MIPTATPAASRAPVLAVADLSPEVGTGWNTESRDPASPPSWLPQLLDLHAADPGSHPYTLSLLLFARHGIETTGRTVRAALEAAAITQPPAVEEP